jgi:proteasome alpha subunit
MLESANEMMEYDRSNVMFAPDGRLIQVEYARKTVNQGSVTIGMVFKDGVFIVADKRGTNGLLKGAEKIMQIDEHMGAAMSGLISDGRILIESAQLYAQNNRLDYDTPIDVLSMVKYVCRFMQAYTQFGGYRPFGVSLLLAGVDDKPQLYVTEPSGIYFGYKAAAIGEKDDEVREILRKKYKDGLTYEQGLSIALKAMSKILKGFDIKRVDAMTITKEDKRFTMVEQQKLNKIWKSR